MDCLEGRCPVLMAVPQLHQHPGYILRVSGYTSPIVQLCKAKRHLAEYPHRDLSSKETSCAHDSCTGRTLNRGE